MEMLVNPWEEEERRVGCVIRAAPQRVEPQILTKPPRGARFERIWGNGGTKRLF